MIRFRMSINGNRYLITLDDIKEFKLIRSYYDRYK